MKHSPFKNEWQWSGRMAGHLRFPFIDMETIKKNYSQSFQDIFLLMMLGGKKAGHYLEVGGSLPITNNNTFLPHSQFGWGGLTIEPDPSRFPDWRTHRPQSHLLIADALAVDYAVALKLHFAADGGRIDYLHLDIEPGINTLAVLKRLPLEAWRFSVITFEAEAYQARDEGRSILSSHGYALLARDVSVLSNPLLPSSIPFEDWWVDPEVVGEETIRTLQAVNAQTGAPQNLIFAR